MPDVKLNLGQVTIPAKVELAQSIVTDVTGNEAFPTPMSALEAVTAAADALSVKSQAARTARLAAVGEWGRFLKLALGRRGAALAEGRDASQSAR